MQSVSNLAELEALASPEEKSAVFVRSEHACFFFRQSKLPLSNTARPTSRGGNTRWVRLNVKV